MVGHLTIYQFINRRDVNTKRLAAKLGISRETLIHQLEIKGFSQEEETEVRIILQKMEIDFEQKRAKNKMGLRSGMTREFNFSRKKRLSDPCTIKLYGLPVKKTMAEWIQTQPALIKSLVFEKKCLLLADDSMQLLTSKTLIEEIIPLQELDEPILWHPIPEYDGFYEINDIGTIKGVCRMIVLRDGKLREVPERIIQTRINNRGYVSLRLSKNGQSKTKFLHILLAQTFIPNPESKLFVNHKNGIKTDNRIENLEWCTHSENIIHAYRTGLIDVMKLRKPKNMSGKTNLATLIMPFSAS